MLKKLCSALILCLALIINSVLTQAPPKAAGGGTAGATPAATPAAPAPAPTAPAPAPTPSGGGAEAASPSKVITFSQVTLDDFKTRYCPLIPKLGGGEDSTVPEWKNEMDMDEVIELALVNLGYGLTTDAIMPLPATVVWQKKIIDMIAFITKTTCSSPGVSNKFINAAKHLFMYYLLKRERLGGEGGEGGGAPTPSPSTGDNLNYETNKTADWADITMSLAICAAQVSPIGFNDDCGEISSYTDKSGNEVETTMLKEEMDEMLERNDDMGLDVIVDSIWWMFTASYARCYAYFYPEEDIMLSFYLRFRDDILALFSERWTSAGSLPDQFKIIFGPLRVSEELENLRKCATAAYNYEGLGGRHLARPILVSVDGHMVRNFKLNIN